MISSLDQKAWDEKIIDLGGSILQSYAWGRFQEELGNKVIRFSGPTYSASAVGLPLPMGKKYYYCPKGPVGEAADNLADLKTLGEDKNVIFVRLEPQKPILLPVAAKEVQPKTNWVLSVDQTEDQLLVGMKPKTRYNINLAFRKGVVVREGGASDLVSLWQMMLETAARNKFQLHPQNYYLKMFEILAPKHLKILVASYQGKPLAGMILTLFSDSATYLHGGSSAANKEAMAPYLLHWEAIRLAKSFGCKFYDFGGIASNNDSRHAWSGISRFKKGFGGFEINSAGVYDLIFSPIWYNVYKQARLVRRLIRPV
ncbi:MAG: peptidoglycan bridge formation glycyltransferase FemA/FemB family protein [Candidatus Doudnabacteria bacterium]|nr:peptidoglycan bridge formation glycyltransferase FemA/FemB family protein [Candidatus Doudnabacteria bacterium]